MLSLVRFFELDIKLKILVLVKLLIWISLLLTVDTDGSITPRDAFEEAAAILVNQYTALAGKTRVW